MTKLAYNVLGRNFLHFAMTAEFGADLTTVAAVEVGVGAAAVAAAAAEVVEEVAVAAVDVADVGSRQRSRWWVAGGGGVGGHQADGRCWQRVQTMGGSRSWEARG
jgi:hypothetical protein